MRRHAKASFAGSTLGSGIRRGRLGLICLCVLGLAAFLGSSAPSASAQACPNESFRSGASGNLPDCRAYEIVSAIEKEGFEIEDTVRNSAAPAPIMARDGNTVIYVTERGVWGEDNASSSAVNTFIAGRGGSWSNVPISAPFDPYGFLATIWNYGYSEDLTKWMFAGPWRPQLTPDASENTTNTFVRNNTNGSYKLVSVGTPPELAKSFECIGLCEFAALGIDEDASHIVMDTPFNVELTPDSAEAAPPYLYDWNEATGALSLIGHLPGGAVSPNVVTLAAPNFLHPVSADGSRIFFHEGGGGECGLCVRINGATTQLVSETGTFQIASSDGSLAYFTDGGDLMRYDVATEGIVNLTEAVGPVQGVLGASADGSRVYFAAENDLYQWTAGGGSEFVLEGIPASNWDSDAADRSSRVTPDGMHVAFQSTEQLTEYDNKGIVEVYLYSAATDTVACASCNPIAEPTSGGGITNALYNLQVERLPRNLSDDGRYVFFETDEALVPQDSNNEQDVYGYDAADGDVALISTGTDTETARFDDASSSGSDVIFATREPLVPVDQDRAMDVYDARVNGGLASQHPAPPAPPCTGDECRGQSSSPDLVGAASAGFVGKGNVSQKQNCNKLGREAKKLSNRAKRLRKNAKTAKRNGKSAVAKKRNKKATRLAKRARSKSKSAKRCRKANRRASK